MNKKKLRQDKAPQKSSERKKRPSGRPSKYKPEYVEQVYKLAVKGFTDKEVGDFFKVDESTVTRWKQKYSDFCTSLKKGKYEFDSGKVVNSLLRRALGYQFIEKTRVLVKDADSKTGEGKLVTVKEVTKEVPPDPTSMIFWLKNRQPDEWRDRQEHKFQGSLRIMRPEPIKKPKNAGK